MGNLLQKIEGAFMAVISLIGSWFSINLSNGESLYNHLTDAEKQAAQWGSGLIHLVNSNLTALPADIVKLIQTTFPGLDLDTVHGFLDILLNTISTVQGEVPLTLEDAIAELQTYLSKYEGGVWGIISKAAAALLAIAFSPETPVQKIEGALEYVYHLIVKPNIQATIAPAVDTAANIVNEATPGSAAASVATAAEQIVDTPPAIANDNTKLPESETTATDPDMDTVKETIAENSAPVSYEDALKQSEDK